MFLEVYHHAMQNSMHAHWIIINCHSHSNSHGYDDDDQQTGNTGTRQATQFCAACLQKLPQFLQALVELLLAAGVYPLDQAPQHVLINSYSKAAGISPHMDGPLYSPCVATITLGGPALMAFHEVLPDGTQGQLATEVFTTILATACFLTCIYHLV